MAEIELNERQKWELIRATVEGVQSPASCSFIDGKIVYSATPIPKQAKPDFKLLVDILRSEEPLPPFARDWLADLFDPNGESRLEIKRIAGRSKGPGRTGLCHNWDAAEYAEMRREIGALADDPAVDLAKCDPQPEKYEVAVQEAAKKFKIAESAVKAAMKSRRDARRIHDVIE